MWSRARPEIPDRDRRRCRESVERRLLRAERQLARGRSEAAARQLLDTAAVASDLQILNRIGDFLVRAGHVDRAVTLFERVGRAYADDGFWAKAIAIYRKVLRHDPWRPDVRTQLAFLYQRSGLPTGGGI